MSAIRYGVLLAGLCCALAVTARAGDIVIESNVTYAEVGDVKLQLDIARPAEGTGPFPALICIHGGGWSGGNRHAFRNRMEQAAQRGYVAMTISYRLTQPDPKSGVPKEPFPSQLHDCKAAVRWLRAHAADYSVDPERIAVMGASAGGHLSLLLGVTSATDELEGTHGHADQSSRVRAVVNIFGPTDLPELYRTTPAVVGLLRALCNGTPESAARTFAQASPVTFVSADDPPILTLHGAADKIVPVEQAHLLDAKLKAAGVEHQLVILKDQGHGFQGAAAQEADTAMWEFLAKHLAPR